MAEVLYIGGPKDTLVEWCSEDGPPLLVNVPDPAVRVDATTGEATYTDGGRATCTYHRRANPEPHDGEPKWALIAANLLEDHT